LVQQNSHISDRNKDISYATIIIYIPSDRNKDISYDTIIIYIPSDIGEVICFSNIDSNSFFYFLAILTPWLTATNPTL
jgi:hypothetical protein